MYWLMIYVTVSSLIGYIPQIVKMIRTQSVNDLSFSTLMMWVSSSFAYMVYAINLGDTWVRVSCAVELVLYMTLVFLYLLYRNNPER